jgi:ribonuclease Z
MTFNVTILGNNAAIPAFGRHTTAQVVNHNEEFFLLDCGEDTQSRLKENKIKPGRLNNIFISHLHGDHYFGLIGLITTLHLNRRTNPLNIYAPKGIKEIIELQLNYSNTITSYSLNFFEVDTQSHYKIFENQNLQVFTIPHVHRIPCCGYLMLEKKGVRRINVEEINKFNIPFELYDNIKSGLDITLDDGTFINNKSVTLDPHTIRSYAFCSDTIYTDTYIEIIKGVDLLYHESTFLSDDESRAKERYHCTAKQAAQIALAANAKKLLLGHFSSKYENTFLFENEAREIFEPSYASVEKSTYIIENI